MPASVLPVLVSRTGLPACRACRASRAKRRASTKPSTYIAMTVVPGSAIRCSRKSQISRSHWLPIEAQTLKRIPSARARSNIDTIRAPLWLISPTPPGVKSHLSMTSEDVSAIR
jgi:hypothetical protein